MKIYLVGGAVRDELMGIEPKDRDYVVTGSAPEELLALGYEQVGASFPVFLHPVTREEYALARTERKNGVGYHGFDVCFTPDTTIEDDLARRDLTINAMAKDMETGEIIDPYGGRVDLQAKMLRHTSNAFGDDPLRVIRLARFAARYEEFEVDPSTVLLCQKIAASGELNALPPERHLAELDKVLRDRSRPSRFFLVLGDTDVLQHCAFYDAMALEGPLFAAFGGLQNLAPDDRLDTFASLLPQLVQLYPHLFSTTVRSVAAVMKELSGTHARATSDDIAALLERLRAWSRDHPTFPQFMRTWAANERVFGPGYALLADLHLAQRAAEHVTASMFPDMEGKALGEAIRQARREAIRVALAT